MAIVAAKAGALENGGRQDQPVGHHDGHIRIQVAKRLLFFFALQRGRRTDLDAELFGVALYWRGRQLKPTATGRTRWLAVDGRDFMPLSNKGIQERHREIGRPHEYDAQSHCPELHREPAWRTVLG